MSWDVVLVERKLREENLNGKTYEEIQEMINDSLDFIDKSTLANITLELLDKIFEKRSEVTIEVADVGNYTCNVYKMYVKAMDKTISDFDGMKASDAISLLEYGMNNMVNDPNEYKKLNPENGWGNYDGALKYLSVLLKACRKYPNSTIKVS